MIATLSAAVPADAGPTVNVGGHDRSRPAPELRSPPPLEPGYDDEKPPQDGPGTAELLPFAEPSPRRFTHEVDFFDPQPTSRRCLPDPGTWAAHFVQAALEMLAGRRPVGQLQHWATLSAVAGVRSAARRRADQAPTRRPGPPRRPGAVAPVAPTGPAGPGGSTDTVHSVHVSEPADGVAEVCAVIRQGHRYRALAARMEGLDGRWQCVSFRLL